MKKLKLLCLMLLTLLLLLWAGVALADTTGPSFLYINPADRSCNLQPNLYIGARLNDYDGIKDNIKLTLDGQPITTYLNYDEIYDAYDELIGLDYCNAQLSYYATGLSEGLHTVTAVAEDWRGNISSETWTFNVNIQPKLINASPLNYTNNNKPLISANLIDSNFHPVSTIIYLDNSPVPASFDPVTGIISYQVNYPLADGVHDVFIEVLDSSGNFANLGWGFVVDTVKPVYQLIYPSISTTLTSSQPSIKINAYDIWETNQSSLVFKVDGVVVPATIEDSWSSELEDIDPTTDIIRYKPTAKLTDGVHTFNISLADLAGNRSTGEWTFNIQEPPQFINQNPTKPVTSLTPEISVFVSENSQLNPSSIIFKINGQKITPKYDPATGKISYTPVTPLPQEAYAAVSVFASDIYGNSNSINWQFYAYKYTKEMPISDCSKCHTGFPANHPMDNCYGCHGSGASVQSCGGDGCHSVPHTSDYIQSGTCVNCHNNSNTAISSPIVHTEVFGTALLHKSPTTGCDLCHATTLTREHVLRQDAAGNFYNCETCHVNPPAAMANKVFIAIANKDARCEACHDGVTGPHPAHNTNLDSKCASCHSNTLLTENQYHRYNSCSVCHSSSDKIVSSAISAKATECNSCHDKAHTLNLSSNVPTDIPLFGGFSWTPPQKAQIWAGESWLPADFNSPEAKLIISNRRTDITGADVFNWYSSNLTLQGWSKVSGPTTAGNNFSLVYNKVNRVLTINFYGGITHDASSPFSGYRLELIYK